MPEEFRPGCQRPPIKRPFIETVSTHEPIIKEAQKPMIRVGKAAPDFTTSGFHGGKFMNFSLSEYKGKWVLLCFYPGDFTFV